MRVICVLFILHLFLYSSSTVTVDENRTDKQTERLKFGGISEGIENLIVLDEATTGLYYQFDFMIKREGILQKESDTLFLALGSSQSVFFDPIYKQELENQRRNRIARSKKAKLINPEYENLNDISELININSDYKEDNPGDPEQIYKNRNSGVISSVYNSYVENIRCDQEIEEMLQWQMYEENDTILGYACLKAGVTYAGRDYTAWFAPEIPINDGPWKFWGLPGLILKVTDKQELFEWIAIGLENLDGDIVINKEDYEKAKPNQFRDFVDRATSTVMVSFYSNNVLYLTNKERPYTKIPIELFDKE